MEKKRNFPKHSKESRFQGQPPYPHSQFSQAGATGNTAGSPLTDIPHILLACAHEKEQAEKRETGENEEFFRVAVGTLRGVTTFV